MKLYIYTEENNTVEATIEGRTNEACEAKATELNFDGDEYAWTYCEYDLAIGCIEEYQA